MNNKKRMNRNIEAAFDFLQDLVKNPDKAAKIKEGACFTLKDREWIDKINGESLTIKDIE